MSDDLERVRRVKREHEPSWLAREEVVAVGIGQAADGRPAIVISVRADSDRVRRELPAQVEGVPLEIRVTGDLRAL